LRVNAFDGARTLENSGGLLLKIRRGWIEKRLKIGARGWQRQNKSRSAAHFGHFAGGAGRFVGRAVAETGLPLNAAGRDFCIAKRAALAAGSRLEQVLELANDHRFMRPQITHGVFVALRGGKAFSRHSPRRIQPKNH